MDISKNVHAAHDLRAGVGFVANPREDIEVGAALRRKRQGDERPAVTTPPNALAA